MRFAAVAVLLAAMCGSAHAATPFELYEQGRYDDAIAAGRAQNDAAGFTIAARAQLAAEAMLPEPCLPCLKNAEVMAYHALRMKPSEPLAGLYVAIALGQEGRAQGVVAALSHGYATSAKMFLHTALTANPDNAFVWAALGGWNIEVVRNGGATLARMLLGANIADGLSDFDKAFALNPGNVAIRFQYALTLSGYDLENYRPQIEAALDLAATGKPQGAYEAFAQTRARALLDTLKKDDLSKYDQLVRRYQGYTD